MKAKYNSMTFDLVVLLKKANHEFAGSGLVPSYGAFLGALKRAIAKQFDSPGLVEPVVMRYISMRSQKLNVAPWQVIRSLLEETNPVWLQIPEPWADASKQASPIPQFSPVQAANPAPEPSPEAGSQAQQSPFAAAPQDQGATSTLAWNDLEKANQDMWQKVMDAQAQIRTVLVKEETRNQQEPTDKS